ncbi:MAG: hypothetical protein JNM39_12125 [Bdellovibrionaceae bacterium]|nr:hypothetical protein [Pseudobdellovibrionaceae bacterium]
MSLLRLRRQSTDDPFWEKLLKGIIERVILVQPQASVFILTSNRPISDEPHFEHPENVDQVHGL